MNWFERHLNWTLGLCGYLGAFVGGFALAFLIGLIIGVVLNGSSSVTVDEVAGRFGEVAYTIAFVVIIFGVTVWYLAEKGRHMGHLAWLICPFGFIVLLCLKNHGKVQGITVENYRKENIQKQGVSYDTRQQCLSYYREELELKALQEEAADEYNDALVKYGMSINTNREAANKLQNAADKLTESATEILKRRSKMTLIPDIASSMYFAWQMTYSDYLAWASAQAAAIAAAAEGMTPYGKRVKELLAESEKSRRKAENEEKKFIRRLNLSNNELMSILNKTP